MASSDMKAVITLTADASGVQSGVAQAMKSLNGMADQLGQFRNGVAGQAVMMLFNAAKNSFEELAARITDAAHAYSPAAMAGANNLAITQQQQDQRLGAAFGDVVGFIDNFKAQALVDVTDYLIKHKEDIGKAMESLAVWGAAVADVMAQLGVGFANLVTTLEDMFSGKAFQEIKQDPARATTEVGAQMMFGGTGQLIAWKIGRAHV